jgi:hypothetical protein
MVARRNEGRLPDWGGGVEVTFGTWSSWRKGGQCWGRWRKERLVVGWSQNSPVLRSSRSCQFLVLDRGEAVHDLHGLVHPSVQGGVHVLLPLSIRTERRLV